MAVSGTGSMGVTKITLFAVCAVIVLSTLTASASLGPSGYVLWLVAVIFFVLPNMMITSELGTTYPAEGGIYNWIDKAFGRRMSARAIILYWLSNGIWMGANFILLVGMFATTFMPGMSLFTKLAIVIVLIWLTVAFVSYKANVGIWVTITGAIIKVIVVLSLGIGGFIYVLHHPIANEFNLHTMTPSASSGIHFFSAIIYNLTGFELVACMGSNLRNPKKDMPKSIFAASMIVVALYVIGSLGILFAIPLAHLNLVSGVNDAATVIFSNYYIVAAIVVLFLATIITDQMTWTMAPSRAAAEAALAGDLPKFIGKKHPKYGTPYGAAIVLGVTGTIVTLVYSYFAAGDSTKTFWSIFSFSSVCIIFSYLMYYPSFIKLRLIDKKN